MLAATFQLLPIFQNNLRTNRQYLFHRRSNLRINIYPLTSLVAFEPKPNELQYYARMFSWWIAFETEGYKQQPQALIQKGIKWYAALKMCPNTPITQSAPDVQNIVR
ncbi:hypothetical protein [Mucilaginibacter sp. CSA2-8R]|uniref:hypothetical protein n=1 Tax=Mucilaginibacter sp. CSA2-8R TaxID=3141542 RepID=UPI00315D6AD2